MALLIANSTEVTEALERWRKAFDTIDFESSAIGEAVRAKLYERITAVREELVKAVEGQLGTNRRHAEAGILRHTARDGMVGSVDIVTKPKSRGEAFMGEEQYQKKKAELHRKRTIKPRTLQIRSYTGADRNFILHILNSGRDQFKATSDGPAGRGSGATYGRRGAIAGIGFMQSGRAAMDKAADLYGKDIIEIVNKVLEEQA